MMVSQLGDGPPNYYFYQCILWANSSCPLGFQEFQQLLYQGVSCLLSPSLLHLHRTTSYRHCSTCPYYDLCYFLSSSCFTSLSPTIYNQCVFSGRSLSSSQQSQLVKHILTFNNYGSVKASSVPSRIGQGFVPCVSKPHSRIPLFDFVKLFLSL